jgi:hypothetical protein
MVRHGFDALSSLLIPHSSPEAQPHGRLAHLIDCHAQALLALAAAAAARAQHAVGARRVLRGLDALRVEQVTNGHALRCAAAASLLCLRRAGTRTCTD